jgi:hypothetical protein
MRQRKARTTIPLCNCGSACHACQLLCHCDEHWHHENQAEAMQQKRLHNKGKKVANA